MGWEERDWEGFFVWVEVDVREMEEKYVRWWLVESFDVSMEIGCVMHSKDKRFEILAESIEDDLPSIFDKERKSLLE